MVNGRNHTKYCYYRCKNKPLKLCNAKTIDKNVIEDTVVNETKKILTDKNIQKIAKNIAKLCKSSNNGGELTYLNKLLKQEKNKMENLLKALENGDLSDVILERIRNKKLEIANIENKITQEKLKNPVITERKVEQFLKSLRNGDINDVK